MSHLPFYNIYFTSTSLDLETKEKLNKIIPAMGGTLLSDLTIDVKILIVGSLNTPKFKFCLKNRTDLTFTKPNDLIHIYRRFLDKELMNLQVLDEYPWPLFETSSFCLSRLSSTENLCFRKNYLCELIKYFGGNPTSSLSQDSTFLITIDPRGNRYNAAINWKIPTIHPQWLIDCCNCQRILDPAFYNITKIPPEKIGKGSHNAIRNIIDYGSKIGNPIYQKISKQNQNRLSTQKNKNETQEEATGDLFKGFAFYSYGFTKDQQTKLDLVLKKNGAEILGEYDTTATYVLVPSTNTLNSLPLEIKSFQDSTDSNLVTEWFIERCLHYNVISTDTWSIPRPKLQLSFKLKIHITGFSDIEHLHISKLITNLNLTFTPNLTEDCDFLVANLSSLGLTPFNSPKLFTYKYKDVILSKQSLLTTAESTRKKINAAKKWDIPVVSVAYIWEISEIGVLPNLLDYKWCIFGPKKAKPANTFLEYARSVSGGTFQTQISIDESRLNKAKDRETDNEKRQNKLNIGTRLETAEISGKTPVELPVRLPSPKKKKLKNWPRLVGIAHESQLKSTMIHPTLNSEFKNTKLDLTMNKDEDNHNIGSFEKHNEIGYEVPVFKKKRRVL